MATYLLSGYGVQQNTTYGKQIVRDSQGTYFRALSASVQGGQDGQSRACQQVFVVKSIDNGERWIDTKFPQTLTQPTGQVYTQYAPAIAIDSKDTVHMVWYGYDPTSAGTTQIRYACLPRNGTWSIPVNIQPVLIGYNQLFPSLHIDAQDRVHVVWVGRDPAYLTYDVVKYSVFDPAAKSWSNSLNFMLAGSAHQMPQVVTDRDGKVHIASAYGGHIGYATNKFAAFSASSANTMMYPYLGGGGYNIYSMNLWIDPNTNRPYLMTSGNHSSVNSNYYTLQIFYASVDTQLRSNNSSDWGFTYWNSYQEYATSVATDPSGRAHILTYNSSYGPLLYLQYEPRGNQWFYPGIVNLNPVDNYTCNYDQPAIHYCPTDNQIMFSGRNYNWMQAAVAKDHSTIKIKESLTSPGYDSINKIVRDSKGTLYKAFYSQISTKYQIQTLKSKDDGITWTDTGCPQVSGYDQKAPSLGIAPDDTVHLVWHGTDPTYAATQIKYSKYDPSANEGAGAWSAPVNIQPIAGFAQTNPNLEVDLNGKVHVVWESINSSSTTQSIAYTNNASGAWKPYEIVYQHASYHQNRPNIGVDLNGKALITWYGADASNGANTHIQYADNRSGAWVRTNVSYRANYLFTHGYHQQFPILAVDSKGNPHIAWHGMDLNNAGNTQIKYATLVNGLWTLHSITSDVSYNQQFPYIVLDALDKAHIMWHGGELKMANPSTVQIRYSHNQFGPFSEPVNITQIPGYKYNPCLFFSADALYVSYYNQFITGFTFLKYFVRNNRYLVKDGSRYKTIQATGYSANAAAGLTANSSIGMTASSDIGDTTANSLAYMAFDGNDSTQWQSTNASTAGYLQLDFGVGNNKVISKYMMKSNAGSSWNGNMPKSWIFEASTDNSTWRQLHSVMGAPAWGTSEQREFLVPNDKPYRYYRIKVYENYGGGQGLNAIIIPTLEMYETVCSWVDVGSSPDTAAFGKGFLNPALFSQPMFQQLTDDNPVLYAATNKSDAQKIRADVVPRMKLQYRTEVLSPVYSVLKDWTNISSDEITRDKGVMPFSMVGSCTPYTLQVTVNAIDNLSAQGTVAIAATGQATLTDTAPTISLNMTGLTMTLDIGDQELDQVAFLVKLNGSQIYPVTPGYDSLQPAPRKLVKTFKSTEIKINQTNTIRVEAVDQFNALTIQEFTFTGRYAGLMFADPAGTYYSTDLGAVLKYLDFGQVVAGQTSTPAEVRLINTNSFSIQNLTLKVDNSILPAHTHVELSKTDSSWVAKNSTLLFSQTLAPGEQVPFYVRIVTDKYANQGATFNLYAKADPV